MARRITRGIATAGIGLLLAVSAADHAGAVIDDPDIDSFAAYEYRVIPDTGTVEVTVELAVTADKPNRSTSGGGYYEYYFPGYFLAVPDDAVDLAVIDGSGRELSYEITDRVDGAMFLEFDFRRNIFYRQTANVVVSYSLPKGEARTDALTRVNDAYAGFEVWLTPQLEGASVTVKTPRGFEDRSTGSDPFRTEFEDDEKWFVVEDVDPENYWAFVSVARDSWLTKTELEIEDSWTEDDRRDELGGGNNRAAEAVEVEVRAWPGDDAWTEHVIGSLEQGLPVLIDQVGLPWPVDDELEIIESYSPYLSGYAGWYDPSTDEIEIGDELDTHLVFHELSHVWFNDELFDQRWITEGLADEFGAAIVERLGEDLPEPATTSLFDGSAQPLNRWHNRVADEETESWAYGASWTVTRAIVDEIGLDALSEVVQAVANDEIAYLGEGDPEQGRKRRDWRLYLDLVENRGGVTDDAIVELFRDWVLSETEITTVERRAESRAVYAELQRSGDDWAPPLAVRQALSNWNFAEAGELMQIAEGLLEERANLVELLAPLDASLPRELERRYETADEDLTDPVEQMSLVSETAQRLRTTNDELAAATGFVQRVGAIGGDNELVFAQAVSDFEQGLLGAAERQATAVDADVADLNRRGTIRLAIAAALVIVIVAGLWFLLRRRRGARRTKELPSPTVPIAAAPTPAATPTASPAGTPASAAAGPWAPPTVSPTNPGTLAVTPDVPVGPVGSPARRAPVGNADQGSQ